ncbi:MAG: hypothetical protein PHD04_03910 [Candidatus Pacebacteria bacterium]|nr:hypothetical protein [Candidatus Paceibacterota bacterium]
MIKNALEGYQKHRESVGWDKYAERLSLSIRETLADKLKECRENGFYDPQVSYGKIVFGQLVSKLEVNKSHIKLRREAKQ